MTRLRPLRLALLFLGCALPSCGSAPPSAREIVAACLRAHGGRALADWQTLLIKGEVRRKDGRLWFRGAYTLYAQKPDKLRMETDLTKFERGRFFFSEIYNGGKGWMIRNLIPAYRDELARRYKAKLDRCDGIAFYTAKAEAFSLAGEETVDGARTYVIEASLPEAKARLYIDEKSFYLVKEVYDNVTLIYSDFKSFGKSVRAASVREITEGRRRTEVTYKYDSIELDVPIDAALFEEEMPTG